MSEPGADRGPHAGSPRGVVAATGSNDPPVFRDSQKSALILCSPRHPWSGRYRSRFWHAPRPQTDSLRYTKQKAGSSPPL